MTRSHNRLLFVAALLPLATAVSAGALAAHSPLGAFTCDFALPGDLPLEIVGPTIERDRMYMAERPGMIHKHIPFRPEPAANEVLSGGRYLFESVQTARDYKTWVVEDFVLDGVHFLERPEFLRPDCHWWVTIGAREFGDIHHAQEVLRTERWEVNGNPAGYLRAKWPEVVDEAQARGITAVWLLHQPEANLVNLVYFRDRALPTTPPVADPGLLLLEAEPPLGDVLARPAWNKVQDLTSFSLNIWFPFIAGDRGEPSLWPNSPPLPAPYAGDGVCQVSRGETWKNAKECLPTCGNTRADEGETTWNCPGDVRPYWTLAPNV